MSEIDWINGNGFSEFSEQDYYKNKMKENEKTFCEDCGGEMKISKKGNVYCSKLCWLDEE